MIYCEKRQSSYGIQGALRVRSVVLFQASLSSGAVGHPCSACSFKTVSNAIELAMIASSTALMQACKRGAPSAVNQGSQRIARPSLERGMEAASGKKRTPQHEGVTEGRGGNGRKPPPPHTMCHTPHWTSAGRVAFY